MSRAERFLRTSQLASLSVALVCAVLVSRSEQWQPTGLLVALLAIIVASETFSVELKRLRVSASSVALVAAMVLLGPAPAIALGVASQVIDAARRPMGWATALTNLSTFAVFVAFGGALMQALDATSHAAAHDWVTIPIVVGVFVATNFLNFVLVALDFQVTDGEPVGRSFREAYLPVFPAEFAMALLTAAAVLGYYVVGSSAIGLLVLVALTFQFLTRTVWESTRRGEALERRTHELSALQVGLLSTVLQTLSLRDAMTARHSAAVARYAREIASELGLSADEQDLVHTAGLLHDIGKFIFPDSILFAARGLTLEEYAIVRRHPEQGARLVERIEGYGPVAEIIWAHHERVDGTGYPRRLPAAQIPLASRIISVADTYDVLVARDSYRECVDPQTAMDELERVAGTQLDATVVGVFVKLLQSRGVSFRHTDEADFETELSFERRVRDYAAPRAVPA